MTAAIPYRFSALTREIEKKDSPLRLYFDATFPWRKPIYDSYRSSAGPLLVEGGTAAYGTLGAAFDFMVRLTLDPMHKPHVAFMGLRLEQEFADLAVLDQVLAIAQTAAADCRTKDIPEELARACWVFALCTELYRTNVGPETPLVDLMMRDKFTLDNVLGLAPINAVEQLTALHRIAVDRLYPSIANPPGKLVLGPVFVCSRLCNADADVIVDGLLLDLKVRLGTKNPKTGVRPDTLDLPTVYQLLGYALFDTTDEFGIDKVGIYSARYGLLKTWPIDEFMTTLSPFPVKLADERERVWQLLSGK